MKAGFSLLELSIVLVIIGLLAGGVMTGQSLIHAAELRAVSTEYTRWTTAMNAFRDKYQALPGDMKNATAFWGAADGSTGLTAGCKSTAGTGTTTCNGNGDGIMGVLDPTVWDENLRFWQHLANAGLIEGSFTGAMPSATSLLTAIGTNVPASKYPNAGWSVWYLAAYPGDGSTFATTYNNNFIFGTQSATATFDPIITAQDAWNIDSKVDDGKPGYGKILVEFWAACTDAASQTDLGASYKLTATGANCALYIKW